MNTYSNWCTHLEQVLFDLFDMTPQEVHQRIARLEMDRVYIEDFYNRGHRPDEVAKYFV